MLLEIILAITIGILAGTITGLIPGIHTNLLAVFIISISGFLLNYFSLTFLFLFIATMAITHTFVDFIPSIFLGAPDEDTALSIAPGHDFLLKGQGHQAVLLTLIGSSIALIITIIIIPIFMFTIPLIYPFLQKIMSFILILASIFLLSRESQKITASLIIFFLAGFLGIATLNLPTSQPLLPLLTGLFGSSTIIYSISQRIKIPKQKIEKLKINKKQLIKPIIATSLVSPICSFLPGLGASQAAIIGSEITGDLNRKQFLILLGSINTLVMSVSFATLYLINKSRTGAANAIQQLSSLSFSNLIYIILVILLSSIITIFITVKISKFFAKNINKINYTLCSSAVLIILLLSVIFFSGFLGFLIFIISSILGLTSIYLKIRRSFLMGALLIPTILLYLPFS
jgi:putative membrane protein